MNNQSFLLRDSDGFAKNSMLKTPKRAQNTINKASVPMSSNAVILLAHVDCNLVEIFVSDGVASLSALLYPNEAAVSIR